MAAVYISLATALVCGLLLLGVVLWRRHRQRLRLQRRLLVGRQQLLAEEVEAARDALEGFDSDELDAALANGRAALDALHIALIDRQAHLLNYADLVGLQACRLDGQDAAVATVAAAPDTTEARQSVPFEEAGPPLAAPPARDASSAAAAPTADESRETARPSPRTELEAELRERINKLHPTRSRRRRR